MRKLIKPTFQELLAERLTRRRFLYGSAQSVSVAALTPLTGCTGFEAVDTVDESIFPELAKGADEADHVAHGYRTDTLIRWGDPLHTAMAPFDPRTLTADEQERRFGYNNDYIGYFVLPNANDSRRALLCVNHEFTSGTLMFPDVNDADDMTAEQCAVEQAAIGISVLEIVEQDNEWRLVLDSRFNRRLSLRSTYFEVRGPARGHHRLRTANDPTGTCVLGTMRNCGGGVTPWGTYLSAEENINYVFRGDLAVGHPESLNHARFDMPQNDHAWGIYDPRFDLGITPNEPNRFGWIVEVDPFDPNSIPKKRTALGRFMHEGAECVIAPDGRIVVYMGDDMRFEYLYKFVSDHVWDPKDAAKNADLLDHGTLYAARLSADGSVDWLPLVHGIEPLTENNGFFTQADVLIDARRAGDAVGATPMDRPEDVQPDAASGRVYVMCTNNIKRTKTDAANPRNTNYDGHIIEILEPNGDFASTQSSWDVLLLCGDPSDADLSTNWHRDTSANGWFSCPDNAVVDSKGRIWVTTDQGEDWPRTGHADGVWMVETKGPRRGYARHFYRVPIGAEMTGPQFDDREETLFLAVQHPGLDGVVAFNGRNRPSRFSDPATRWPDFDEDIPPRPAVVTVRHKRNKRIGDAAE